MSGWSVSASSIAVPQIIIGEHIVRTDVTTGALVTVPVSAPVEQPPAPAVDIAAVTEAVLSSAIEIAGLGIMPLRSLLAVLTGRVSGAETAVSDVSGRVATVITEQLSNTALDEARAAAQALLDAAQDAATAQAALEAVAATSDIAAIAGRVTTLEGAGPYALSADLSAVDGRVAALESAPGFDGSALAASIADVSGRVGAVDARVVTLEGHDVYVESVVSAAIAVGVADAATALAAAGSAAADAALADAKAVQAQSAADAAQADADAAQSAADAAQETADAAEVKGLRPAVQVHFYDTAAASAEEATLGTVQAAAGAAAAAGKLVAVLTADANATRNYVSLPASPVEGAKFAFINVGADPLSIKDASGTEVAELIAGEGQSLLYINGAYVLAPGF